MEKKFSIPWNVWTDVSGVDVRDDKPPEPIRLPISLEAREWKRFHEIENVEPVLQDSTATADLFRSNQHLLQSEFIRWFCSTLKILNYCHEVGGKKWQGWHHIYSPNKSRRQSEHNPQLNPSGQYRVRLFFMGFWRCFPVDDTIPLGDDGTPLLPRTQNTNELWPMILAKAVWEIASLSAINDREIVDFNPLLCFTGWTWWSQDVASLSPRDRWQFLMRYTRNYSDSRSTSGSLEETQKTSQSKVSADKKKPKRNGKKGRSSKTSTQEDNKRESRGPETKEDFPILTLLCLNDNGDGREDHDEVPQIPPDYPIFVEATSELPDDPTQIKPPLESWKLQRWVPWAVRHGIIDPKDHFLPIRRILTLPPELSDADLKWLDLNEIIGQPMHFHFLFKREYFKCSEAISNIPHPDPAPENELKLEKPVKLRKLTKQKISLESLPQKSHYFQSLKPSRNEPLYLLVDSTGSKFILINFWAYGGGWSSLIIEKYCWFQGNLEAGSLVRMLTRGCASRAICLSPGRHLLKVCCQTRGFYYLTISSDTIFRIGERREIQDLMTSESERTKALANDVRGKLATAFQSLGSPNHQKDLRDLWESYLPRGDIKLSKRDRLRLHETFRAEALDVIGKKCAGDLLVRVKRALRIFFMIDTDVERRGSAVDDADGSEGSSPGESTAFNEESKRFQAMKIQSFFRMLRAKKFFAIRIGRHGRETLKETLQEVLEVFDEQTTCDLLRNFINGIQDFSGFYDCSCDFEKVLRIQKMTGRAVVSSPRWIPLVRQNLLVREADVVFAVMDLFVDLPGYSLRCFDNDSKREIQRTINNVSSFHYKPNGRGFTLLGYGRSKSRATDVEWTLHITTIRGSPQFHSLSSNPLPPITEAADPAIFELSKVYIPNSWNYVVKAGLRVSNSCSASVRLRVSYPRVRIQLRVASGALGMLGEAVGDSVVLLPVVNLPDCEAEYSLEAFVLGDSWPLTEDDWSCVERVRREVELMLMRRLSSSTEDNLEKVKVTSAKVGDGSLEGPYWSLQVLCDPEINVELREDTRRELEILQTKMSWTSQDPSRSERGKDLQEEFRAENCIPIFDSESFDDEDEYRPPLAVEVRTLSPPRDRRRLPPLDLSSIREASGKRTTSRKLMETRIRRQELLKFEETSRHLMQQLEMTIITSLRVPTK